MSNKLLCFFLFIGFHSFSQSRDIIKFNPLLEVGLYSGSIDSLKTFSLDSLNSKDHFFIDRYESEEGLYLVKKNGNEFHLFDFELNLNFGPNTYIKRIEALNDRFISIQTYRYPSGRCSSIYGQKILLDILKLQSLSFVNIHIIECYDENDESQITRCEMKLKLNKSTLLVEQKKADDGLHCSESAEYRIDEDQLVKTKYYSPSSKSLYPIVCVENICTGAHINKIKKNFPTASYSMAPLYKYGYDSDKLGVELSIDGKLQFFMIIPDNLIAGISILSPNHTINGINTNFSLAQILIKYPDAEMYIDLISDWEYIYIKDEAVMLIFKTTSENRIGNYPNDPEDPASSYDRTDITVDMIQL